MRVVRIGMCGSTVMTGVSHQAVAAVDAPVPCVVGWGCGPGKHWLGSRVKVVQGTGNNLI